MFVGEVTKQATEGGELAEEPAEEKAEDLEPTQESTKADSTEELHADTGDAETDQVKDS